MRTPCAAPPPLRGGLRALGLVLAVLAGAVVAAPPAHAGAILFEVCYDGAGTDADDVFTELLGTPGFGLDGWSLQGINGATGTAYRTVSLTGLVIPEDGLLVLATASATGSVLAARDAIANVDWQNGPDALLLVDENGAVADALQYGTLAGFSAGEGTPAADVSAGWSLSRDFLGTDTGNNANDFVGLSSPTPGIGPPSPVPEPGSFALLLAGAASFVGYRHRRRRPPRTRTP